MPARKQKLLEQLTQLQLKWFNIKGPSGPITFLYKENIMDDMTKLAIGATAVVATATAVVGGMYIVGRSIYRAFKKPEVPTAPIPTPETEEAAVTVEEASTQSSSPEFEVIENDEAQECLGEPV